VTSLVTSRLGVAILSFAVAQLLIGQGRAEPVAETSRHLVVICGHPGDAEFQAPITDAANLWSEAATSGGSTTTTILGSDGGASLAEVEKTLIGIPVDTEAWIVLLGHGTYDGVAARFNLRGDDLSDTALAEQLENRIGTTVVINTTASSAPFLKTLSGENRIIITATKTGNQANLTRFSGFLAASFFDPTADRDQDDQVSLLEAFLSGASGVADYYEAEGRLATEHPLLDDNGDRQGTRFEWFTGLEPNRIPKGESKADGDRAHQFHLVPSALERQLTPDQRTRRDAFETQVIALRKSRKDIAADEYYQQLEDLVLQLSEIYLETEMATGRRNNPDR